ncbi:hypothetical protein ACSQ6I_17005 [Anabaena sp. WFMT]|uniref:hypothetical protein n=1 Tax=Anabaena sp. WFMT TaxID=3449730 RepID=UPI003F24B184
MNNKLFTSLSIEQQESVSGGVTLGSLITSQLENLNALSIPIPDNISALDTFLPPNEI